METMKRKWGKPVTEVQQFVPQEFVAGCSLSPGVHIYYAPSQELDGQDGRTNKGENGTWSAWVRFIPDPWENSEPNWVDGIYVTVEDWEWFTESGGKYTSQGRDWFYNTAVHNLPNDDHTNWHTGYGTFYRNNNFTRRTITDDTKNLS